MSVRKENKGSKGTESKKDQQENTKQTKKETRRDRDTYSGLKKRFFSRIKQQFHDIDYAHLLDEVAQKFLSDFMNEWLGANTKNAKLNKSKKHKKQIHDANNARNRDIYSNNVATGGFIDYEKIKPTIDEAHGGTNYEEDLIDFIDSKYSKKH